MSAIFDTSHVRNVGEFFSQHYLDAVLETDLAGTFARWLTSEKSGGTKTPEKALASLAERYFRAAAQLEQREQARDESIALLRDHHARVLEALGYTRKPVVRALPDGTEVALTLELTASGRPFLWVGEAGFGASFNLGDDDTPLDLPPLANPEQDSEQDQAPEQDQAQPMSWAQLLDGPLLAQDHPPRWLLLLAGPDVFLIDRERWPQGRYLHFEFGAMLGHRKPSALRAFAGLLHREVLAPDEVASGGRSLLDEIDEKSHKHAFAVSTDLKFGVQKAIEILGNEVLHYRRTVSKEKVFDKPELAAQLSRECIIYMYRLLFLFYVEARGGEVEAVPVKSDAYRKGLSLERLRDLELLPLHTEKARNGTYIQQSLDQLFKVIHLGWPTDRHEHIEKLLEDAVDLRVRPQRSPLFDPARLELIGPSVKLRNAKLQEIIRLLSLSKEGARGAGGRQRGRISYAQLGINQLGAVYEGLLSYTGFFAQETLHEVKRADDKGKDGVYEHVYYVPASRIGDYQEAELVRDEHGRPITHPKGTFLFRLAGRDREKSASYYTPEVLTRCLTKYTLKERLEGLTADEILELTVCEPAMGSGAFLNEAVSQLAHAYLERKQKELGVTIPAEHYQREHTRVKYHFVAHRVYGVDLNPLAAELAKVSLWLAVLDPELEAPFMNTRLVAGNSLIGARREVYTPAQLTTKAKKGAPNWFDTPPRKLAPGEPRPSDAVYHFLVPNAGMAPYDKDKVVAGLCKDEIAKLKKWHKAMAEPFTPMDVKRLQALSEVIDELWSQHARARRMLEKKLSQPVRLWGQNKRGADADSIVEASAGRHKSVEECEGIAARELRADGPGARVKDVMDLWCSLWMWPIQQVGELPTRDQWVAGVERLLSGGVTSEERKRNAGRFLHWEVEFAEVFSGRGGFDVVLGNPPWVRVEWKEAGVLGDLEPLLVVRKHSAKQVTDLRDGVLQNQSAKTTYLQECVELLGTQAHLGAVSNYAPLQGVKTNLYKCFLLVGGRISPEGAVGLVHQPGVFDDPRGGVLRGTLMRRLRLVAVFANETGLFPDVMNKTRFCLTVLGRVGAINFFLVSNLLRPDTFSESFAHDGFGTVPAIKNERGAWDLRPHRKRIVHVDSETLALFARLYDEPGTPVERACLPVIHSQDILGVLRRFANASTMLADLKGQYFCTVCFDETGRQRDGTIRRETRFPKAPEEWVVSGPHFYVGTPINKSPKKICRHNKDYDVVDLMQIDDTYLPRTNYVPALAPQEYLARFPSWGQESVAAGYRHVHREMVGPTNERTLVPAIIPPGVAHVHAVSGISFDSEKRLLQFNGLASSIVEDFFVKSTGAAHLTQSLSERLPADPGPCTAAVIQRALQLNCLTTHYADLYNRNLPRPKDLLPSANPDPRCANWHKLPRKWTRDAALRTPYARRQALVELDALSALSLGLTLEQLLLIYKVQFPVLQQYERETYYDQRGKIVFTVNRGLAGVGLERKQFEPIASSKAGEALPDYAHDQQGPFEPPFETRDREADMSRAYEFFRERLGIDPS
jgi:hypothetical protein